MTEPRRNKCRHVANQTHTATTRVLHIGIPGRSRSADDLNEETELCPMCSAALVMVLKRIEDPKTPANWMPIFE